MYTLEQLKELINVTERKLRYVKDNNSFHMDKLKWTGELNKYRRLYYFINLSA